MGTSSTDTHTSDMTSYTGTTTSTDFDSTALSGSTTETTDSTGTSLTASTTGTSELTSGVSDNTISVSTCTSVNTTTTDSDWLTSVTGTSISSGKDFELICKSFEIEKGKICGRPFASTSFMIEGEVELSGDSLNLSRSGLCGSTTVDDESTEVAMATNNNASTAVSSYSSQSRDTSRVESRTNSHASSRSRAKSRPNSRASSRSLAKSRPSSRGSSRTRTNSRPDSARFSSASSYATVGPLGSSVASHAGYQSQYEGHSDYYSEPRTGTPKSHSRCGTSTPRSRSKSRANSSRSSAISFRTSTPNSLMTAEKTSTTESRSFSRTSTPKSSSSRSLHGETSMINRTRNRSNRSPVELKTNGNVSYHNSKVQEIPVPTKPQNNQGYHERLVRKRSNFRLDPDQKLNPDQVHSPSPLNGGSLEPEYLQGSQSAVLVENPLNSSQSLKFHCQSLHPPSGSHPRTLQNREARDGVLIQQKSPQVVKCLPNVLQTDYRVSRTTLNRVVTGPSLEQPTSDQNLSKKSLPNKTQQKSPPATKSKTYKNLQDKMVDNNASPVGRRKKGKAKLPLAVSEATSANEDLGQELPTFYERTKQSISRFFGAIMDGMMSDTSPSVVTLRMT